MRELLKKDLDRAIKTNNDIDKGIIEYIDAQIVKFEREKQRKITKVDINKILLLYKEDKYKLLVGYEKIGKLDLVEILYKEIACINRYLPKVMSVSEIELIVNEFIRKFGNNKIRLKSEILAQYIDVVDIQILDYFIDKYIKE